MSEWFETLDGLWGRMWQTLGRGVADGKHPARLPTFATVSPDGWPEARSVVLRSATQEDGTVSVQTDLTSSKMTSLRASPRAALHVWDRKQALQIRLQTEVTVEHGDTVRDIWAAVPDVGRQSYGITPPPGTAISDALDYVKAPDPATFAVLTCQIVQVDLVHLGDDHRRAGYTRTGDWAGQWLSP